MNDVLMFCSISLVNDSNLSIFETFLNDQMIWKEQLCHQHSVDDIIIVYIPKGNCLTDFVHGNLKWD